MAAIGALIDGKYEILKLVGKGGMSKVYLAMDKRLNKQWAVKEIEKKGRDKNNAVVIQSAIAEANMIKSLDHPTLPRIVDIIDNGNVIYIIMDYIEGESLNKVLDREGAQSQEQVIEWAKDLCEVLNYLHTRKPPIIYRDMKPANVMLKPDGSLKLIDFGIAREFKEESIEDTTSLGTKGYAAPEQFGGKGQTDARTDIYCLGVTLYHLITGQNPCEPPYEIYPIRHWNPALSSGLEAIIQKCTQLNPNDRYQSCAELMYALEHYEEADEEYKKEQKSKFNKFISFVSASVACVLVACLMLVINSSDVSKKYEKAVVNASNSEVFYLDNNSSEVSSDCQDAVGLYEYAISLKPNNLENISDDYDNPYFAIVEKCCAECDVESAEDLSAAMDIVTSKENELKKEKRFGELSYKIAEYYLYYAPNMIESKQMSLAKHWLAYAKDDEQNNTYKDTANIMYTLIEFKDKIVGLSKHDDNSSFEDALNAFNSSVASAHKSSDVTVKYDVYRLSLNALRESVSYLKSKDYSEQEILSLVSVIVDDKESFNKNMKEEIDLEYQLLTSKIEKEFKN